jgi:hypothetical protein
VYWYSSIWILDSILIPIVLLFHVRFATDGWIDS